MTVYLLTLLIITEPPNGRPTLDAGSYAFKSADLCIAKGALLERTLQAKFTTIRSWCSKEQVHYK